MVAYNRYNCAESIKFKLFRTDCKVIMTLSEALNSLFLFFFYGFKERKKSFKPHLKLK